MFLLFLQQKSWINTFISSTHPESKNFCLHWPTGTHEASLCSDPPYCSGSSWKGGREIEGNREADRQRVATFPLTAFRSIKWIFRQSATAMCECFHLKAWSAQGAILVKNFISRDVILVKPRPVKFTRITFAFLCLHLFTVKNFFLWLIVSSSIQTQCWIFIWREMIMWPLMSWRLKHKRGRKATFHFSNLPLYRCV